MSNLTPSSGEKTPAPIRPPAWEEPEGPDRGGLPAMLLIGGVLGGLILGYGLASRFGTEPQPRTATLNSRLARAAEAYAVDAIKAPPLPFATRGTLYTPDAVYSPDRIAAVPGRPAAKPLSTAPQRSRSAPIVLPAIPRDVNRLPAISGSIRPVTPDIGGLAPANVDVPALSSRVRSAVRGAGGTLVATSAERGNMFFLISAPRGAAGGLAASLRGIVGSAGVVSDPVSSRLIVDAGEVSGLDPRTREQFSKQLVAEQAELAKLREQFEETATVVREKEAEVNALRTALNPGRDSGGVAVLQVVLLAELPLSSLRGR